VHSYLLFVLLLFNPVSGRHLREKRSHDLLDDDTVIVEGKIKLLHSEFFLTVSNGFVLLIYYV